MYEQPDGWSRVLAQLAKNTVLTVVGREGNFVRVITKDNVSGYVATSAVQLEPFEGSGIS
jgi:hypothetical protein